MTHSEMFVLDNFEMEYDIEGYQSAFYIGTVILKKNVLLPHLHGKLYANRDRLNLIYNGYWKYGLFDGIGYFSSMNGINQYIGTFKNNMRHGFGKFSGHSTFINGTYNRCFFVYEGSWYENKMHGSGQVCKWNDEIYDGAFEYGNVTAKVYLRCPNKNTHLNYKLFSSWLCDDYSIHNFTSRNNEHIKCE